MAEAPAGSAEPAAAAEKPAAKKPRHSWSAWAWKREHLPDKLRFDRPYKHKLAVPGAGEPVELVIHQKKFSEQGFASTVWDSSIVLAKLFERWPERVAGRRCLDLSAGCGLVGVTLAKLGGEVTATDLEPNLPLLRKNFEANGCKEASVKEHTWGQRMDELGAPFDIVTACDVMYIHDAISDLTATLLKLSNKQTELYIAHGRNRQAEEDFLSACKGRLAVETVGGEELDSVFQCVDVTVLRLRRL